MTDQEMPTLHDIIAARPYVYRFLKPTPLYRYFGLSELIGAKVWVKHENHLPGGAYKVRGAVNLVAHLSRKERDSGLFSASTGNHGQGIAFAAPLAAALKLRDKLAGKSVALVMTGGNLSIDRLRKLLAQPGGTVAASN